MLDVIGWFEKRRKPKGRKVGRAVKIACLGTLLLGVSCGVSARMDDGVNLLAGDWSHVDGARMTAKGLKVTGLGRGIVPPADDPDAPVMANPPINLRGPVLKVSGDFALTARLKRPLGARLTFYGTLPYNQDEWRQEGQAVTLKVNKRKLILELQDGIDDPKRRAFAIDRQKLRRKGDIELTLSRIGRRLTVTVDGQTVINVADPGLFDSGEIRIGVDAPVGRKFFLAALTARALNEESRLQKVDSSIPRFSPPPDSLRRLAERRYPHLKIGTAVAAIPLLSDSDYARVLGEQFNMVTPENVMKFQFIHPQPDRYAFADADAIVDFAERNHMAVHGHTLAWKEALPRWVTEGNHDDDELEHILAEHIATVVGRYKGRIASWDVINEPFEPFGSELRTGSPWYQAMGEDYIAFALREAHRADPNAKLYINDYALEHRGPKSDAMYELAKSLLEDDVPLHGIGFQMHEDMTDDYQPVGVDAFRENVQRFIDLGLEVRISEMDVNLQEDDSRKRLKQQAKYYREIFELAKEKRAFTAFSVWGFTDRYSSLQDWWNEEGFGNGLIFDTQKKPKPAYHSLKSSLEE
ncbi:endo-1,4-beta-xylanase [Pistricoccus aurantiacus]|uniref:endo-1,4-beta-xylanase n=1 Tax=Pistricoccus aurantiacus TaxID=1883414 RepID=UPI003631A28C